MALNPSFISVLGVNIHNYSLQEILENIRSQLKNNTSDHTSKQFKVKHSRYVLPIYTVNPEFLVIAHEHNKFKDILNRAFIAVPDGIGILYAGLLKGKRFPERITGIDLVYSCTQLAAEHDFTVGFLGGRQDAAEKVLKLFKNRYPSLNAWSDPGPNIEIVSSPISPNSPKTLTNLIKIDQNSYDMENLLSTISGCDILFVAFGAPKQEYFIEYISSQLTARFATANSKTPQNKSREPLAVSRKLICVGVGGSLDEISGISAQSPHWINVLGFKWLFRLATEPWRWKRQMRLLKFLRLLLSKNNK